MIQLLTFDAGHGPQLGVLDNGKIYRPRDYRTLLDLLQYGAADLPSSSQVFEARLEERYLVPAARVLAPVPEPGTIYFAGSNYRDHVEEMKRELSMPLDSNPRASNVPPWHGIKAAGSTIVGPDAVVQRPGDTNCLDWELELAVVMGHPAKCVSTANALDYVAGYTVANDLSARDYVGRTGVAEASPFKWDWIGQKSFDGSCPMGPAITLAHDIQDVQDLDMKLWVNGELKQDSNTGQMIFSVAEQIAYLSTRITLQPGDVILTGTPAGVGMSRRIFLKPGDVVRQWIKCIGTFEFSIS